MPLLLPNLDDRKWNDLVDEGRSLVPVYGPEWSDHNPSNPGIMLTELLAFIAEMDIFQLNQISDRTRQKFLELVGVRPAPAMPAEALLRVVLAAGAPVLTLPAGVEFMGEDPSSVETRFRTLDEIALGPGTLDSLQCNSEGVFRDLTAIWNRRGMLYPFGENPAPGSEFYLGFSSPLPVGSSVQVFFSIGGEGSGGQERERILQELEAREKDCQRLPNPCHRSSDKSSGRDLPGGETRSGPTQTVLTHHGAHVVWEFVSDANGEREWIELNTKVNEVVDGTRGLTLDGGVVFCVPRPMSSIRVGVGTDQKYYLRCRLEAGLFDAAPILRDVAFNGIPVRQSVPYGMMLAIDPEATIQYTASGAPAPGEVAFIKMALNEKKKIVALDFNGDEKTDPQFLIYDFRAPKKGAAGLLAFEGAFLGFGDDSPNQQLEVPGAPVEASSFELYSLETNQWKAWRLSPDFDASTRRDLHAVLDAGKGSITFGDGEKGRVPPELWDSNAPPREQCLLFAKYRVTRAEAGNLGRRMIQQLADSPHNHAILRGPVSGSDQWPLVRSQIACLVNTLPAANGKAAESLEHAAGRADELVRTSDRAVTLADYETLAKQAPGTLIARVSACANLHPSFPCFQAPGMVTVIVVPFLPVGRPTPTPGLLQSVAEYLRRRRIIGTRVEVVAPTYLDVVVQAEVKSLAGTNKGTLQKSVVSALTKFLDPLAGGSDGSGWPFGRDVYRSEIMRVIDQVPGVDYVSKLVLIGPDGQPQCGNLCVSSTWLVASGAHQITVV